MGNYLRSTEQLIEALSDAHSWVEKYRGTRDDVFDIQEEVFRSIVGALELELSPEEDRRIARLPFADVAAPECYLRAKPKMADWTEEAISDAIILLESALKIEGPNELL